MTTVKQACESWGDKNGIPMTAEQYIKKLKEENARLKEEISILKDNIMSMEIDSMKTH